MRRILRTMTALLIVVCSVCFVNAEVDVDYDMVCLANDGDYTTINVYAPYGADLWELHRDGIICEWGETYGTISELTITATKDTNIGNTAVVVRDEDDNSDYGFEIISVLVYDNYQTDIISAKAGKNKATIKWAMGYSDYYELQYRKAGGAWKTAAWGALTSYTVKGLKKGKKYSFRVRPVTPSYEWGDQYGPWSDSVTLKIK